MTHSTTFSRLQANTQISFQYHYAGHMAAFSSVTNQRFMRMWHFVGADKK